jgi:hypothetical protein
MFKTALLKKLLKSNTKFPTIIHRIVSKFNGVAKKCHLLVFTYSSTDEN